MLSFLVACLSSAALAQGQYCYPGATIQTSDGKTELSFTVQELSDPLVYRFSVRPLTTRYMYIITDDNDKIMTIKQSNLIDLSELGAGKFRIWAASYIGSIFAKPGFDIKSAELASFCYELSENYVAVEITDPTAPDLNAKYRSVYEAIIRTNLLQILEQAVEAAKLDGVLDEDEGPFTVFAPINNAFAALDPATLTALFETPEGELKNILLNHVVNQRIFSTDLADGQTVTTLLGNELTVQVIDGEVFIGGSKVVGVDITGQNGVVHLIEMIINP